MVLAPAEPPIARIGTEYSAEVEQWRSLAEKYFPPDQVDKVLYVINGESGGDSKIPGDGGAAYGLFQSHYVSKDSTPEQQFADAARLYQADLSNGGTGFGDWGEGRLYNGQPFGALGRSPYPYSTAATGTTATATAQQPKQPIDFGTALTRPALDTTATATAAAPPVARIAPAFDPTAFTTAATDTTAESLAKPLDTANSVNFAQGLIQQADPSVQPHLQSVYDAATARGLDPLTEVQSALKDVAGTQHNFTPLATGEGTAPLLPRTPGQALMAASAPFQLAGEAAATVAEPGIEKLPQPLQEPARQAAELAPGIVVGPGSLASKAATLGASVAGGEATNEAGLGRGAGQLVGGLGGGIVEGGIKSAAKGVASRIVEGGGEEAAAAAARTPAEVLSQQLKAAASARPDMLAARRSELGRRISNAAADLEAGGVPARDAFERATAQLGGGQLAEDIFGTASKFDDSLFKAAVDYSKQTGDFFTGKNAAAGLKLLEEGRIPRPFEVEAIGKVFGADVQKTIEDIGDVFKVKRSIETAFTGRATDVPITLGPSGELSADNITAAVQKLLPKGTKGASITTAVQRLIDEERLVAAVGTDGKPVLRLQGPQFNTLEETIREARGLEGALNQEPVPHQTRPPEQPPLIPASDGGQVPPIDTRPPAGNFDWKPGGEPLWKKTAQFAGDILGLLPRAVQTAFDYSYPFRQGALLIRHQQEFWPNFVKGIKAFGSEEYALQRQAAIERAPYNPANLDISHWDPNRKLTDMEEGFMTRLANWIPGVRQSTRAATVFINGLRSDIANTFVRTQLRLGVPLDEAMRTADIYANYLNRATGRGNLGNLESQLPLLNQVFYGLRRNVAMVQAPGYLFNSNPAVRREVWGDFLAFFGVGVATLKIAELAGADVGIDPTSADFGKIRVGDTRVDIWGGYQQLARTVYKIMDGQIRDPGSSEEFISAAAPFLGNKLAPLPSAVINQSDKLREVFQPGTAKKSPTDLATNAFAPLGAQGLVDAINHDGAKGGLIALSGFFGPGVQSYTSAADIGADEIRDGVKSGQLPATYLDKNGRPQPVTNFAELQAADPEAADKFLADNPRVAEDRYSAASDLTRKVRDQQQQFRDRQQERDDTLLATAPAEWRKASGDAAAVSRAYIDGLYASEGEFKKEPQTLLDVAQQKYHEAIVAATDKKTNKVDWDAVDRVVADMSAAEQDLIFKSSLKGETEARKQYLRDVKQLTPYFDVRDQAWQEIAAKSKTLSEFKNFDEFHQSIVDKIYAKTGSHSIAESMADSALGDLSEIMGLKATAYLSHNRNLVPLLDKYQFYIPAILRPLTTNSYRNRALSTLEQP